MGRAPWKGSSRGLLGKAPRQGSLERLLEKAPWKGSSRGLLGKAPRKGSLERLLERVPWKGSSKRLLGKVPRESLGFLRWRAKRRSPIPAKSAKNSLKTKGFLASR